VRRDRAVMEEFAAKFLPAAFELILSVILRDGSIQIQMTRDATNITIQPEAQLSKRHVVRLLRRTVLVNVTRKRYFAEIIGLSSTIVA